MAGAIRRGTMQRVAKRQAVRCMPECYDRDNDDYQEREHVQAIQFDNALEQVQLILYEYRVQVSIK